jgi:hypothetical protein
MSGPYKTFHTMSKRYGKIIPKNIERIQTEGIQGSVNQRRRVD